MSTIIATTLSTGSVSVPTATVVNGSAKVWVNISGTGTAFIRDSLNTSSLTDLGTGLFQVTFVNAFLAVDFSATVGTQQSVSVQNVTQNLANPSTTTQNANCYENGQPTNPLTCSMGMHGDLA